MKRLTALVFAIIVTTPLPAEEPALEAEIHFEDGYEHHFEVRSSTRDKLGTEMTDDGELFYLDESGQVLTKPIHLTPLTKYKLEIVAKVEGMAAFEDNPRALEIALDDRFTQYESTPNASVRLYNSEGESAKVGIYLPRMFFITKNLTRYVHIFYTSKDTDFAVITFQSPHAKLFLKSITVVPETEEGTINPNPDFRYGELSYNGWHPKGGGRIEAVEDGKFTFSSTGDTNSARFPLDANQNYTASVVKQGGRIDIHFMSEEDRRIDSRLLFRQTEYEGETSFFTPEGTSYAYLSTRFPVTLERIEIRKAD